MMKSYVEKNKCPILSEWVNERYLDAKEIGTMKNNFSNNRPFKHLVLKNFLKTDKAQKILNALEKGELSVRDEPRKCRLKQISYPKDKIVWDYNDLLSSENFMDYISSIIEANIARVDGLFAYKYEEGDFFGCHHDKEGERKITFILYLSDMDENDGGSLNLYNSKNGDAISLEKKIIPKFNTLVFFEGIENGFHEVEKVVGNNARYNIVCGFS